MPRRSHVQWFSAIAAVALAHALACGPAAAARHYWTMIPLTPEAGTKPPAWIRDGVWCALSECLEPAPGWDRAPWTDLKCFYTEEGKTPPSAPWTDQELAAVARECGLDGVIVGRYRLDGDTLHIRFRVWTRGSSSQWDDSTNLSNAHAWVSGLVDRTASKLGIPAGVKRPLLSNSKSFELMGRMAEAYLKKRRKAAERLGAQWAKLDPTSPLAAHWFEITRPRNPKARQRLLTRLLRDAPNDRKLWAELAWWRDYGDDLSGARSAYVRALRLDPGDFAYCADLACVATQRKHPAEARKWRHRADGLIAGWPDHLYVAKRYAYCYDDAPALNHLKAALRSGGPRGYLLHCLGSLHYGQRKWRLALSAWLPYLETNPKNARVCHYVGNVYWRLHDWRSAEAYYRESLQVAPGNTIARCNLAFMLLFQSKHKEAESQAKMVLKQDPKYLRAHKVLGLVYGRTGRPLDSMREMYLSWPNRSAVLKTGAVAMIALYAIVILGIAITIKRLYTPDGPRRRKRRPRSS